MNSVGNHIYVISGPSGVGKTTLSNRLLSSIDHITRSISFTSRDKRSDEVDFKDYFFIGKDDFIKKIEKGDFIEWVKIYENYYGTDTDSLHELLSNKNDVLMVIEPHGAFKIKEIFNDKSVLIYILPPDELELKRRLENRAPMTPHENLAKRLGSVNDEMKLVSRYDHAIININLDDCFEKLKNIILAARVIRRK
jgi:guanylate kinase